MTGPRREKDEQGSVSLEMAVLVPVILALFALAVFAGLVQNADGSVQAAAQDAARAASVSATPAAAHSAALAAASSTMASEGLSCATVSVQVDTSGFDVPVGQPATVTATVSCVLALSELAGVVPGHRVETASMTSPLDQYGAR